MFRQRHYESIAQTMRALRPDERAAALRFMQWDLTVRRLADKFAGDRSQFKREKFIQACYR